MPNPQWLPSCESRRFRVSRLSAVFMPAGTAVKRNAVHSLASGVQGSHVGKLFDKQPQQFIPADHADRNAQFLLQFSPSLFEFRFFVRGRREDNTGGDDRIRKSRTRPIRWPQWLRNQRVGRTGGSQVTSPREFTQDVFLRMPSPVLREFALGRFVRSVTKY